MQQTVFYRISLTDDQGNEIRPLGKVRVRIPIDKAREIREGGFSAFLITEDGKLKNIAGVENQGYLEFDTDLLGIFGITRQAVKDVYVYEAEDYFVRQDGIQSDGNVKFCDIQPGETVTFPLGDKGLKPGHYQLAIVSNGYRTAYAVAVNGTLQGVVKREKTGWDAPDLTRDTGTWTMALNGNDTITLTATTNKDEGDGNTFGKIDSIILIPDTESEIPVGREEIVLYAQDWYGGTKDESGGMNVRPEDQIDLAIREQDGFVEGDYVITVRAGGYRTRYRVLVNGENVMELPVRKTDWGYYLNSTASAAIHLVPGDVVTLYADDSWGCIETITFHKGTGLLNHTMENRTGGRMTLATDEKSSGAKASGEEPVYYYQGEGYYKKQADNPAADLQLGEQIEIALADNPQFVDGLYQLTVVSCGTRDHFYVKVNGKKTGRIDRTPGKYGMENMSQDRLLQTVSLRKGDLLCIEAAAKEWGWVDYVRLELVQKAEAQSESRRYGYRAMDYYAKKQADTDTADLQPGDKIEIPLADAALEAGYYYVSATSCGERTKMSVEVNGETVGWIQRNKNTYGESALVRDTMPLPILLKPGDKIAVCAPRDDGWGWVGTVDLIKAD